MNEGKLENINVNMSFGDLHVVLNCDHPPLVEYLLLLTLMAKPHLIWIPKQVPELIEEVQLKFS